MSRFSLFVTLPLYQVHRPGVGKKEWEGTQEGHLILNCQMDIPGHMRSFSAIKKKKKAGRFNVVAFQRLYINLLIE